VAAARAAGGALGRLGHEPGQQALKGAAKRLDLLRARELGPALLDAATGGDGDRPDRLAPPGEEDESRTAITRVGAALEVSGALELLDGLGRRLLAHASEPGQLADANALRRHEREDVGVRWSEIAEAGGAQGRVHVLPVVLREEPQEEPEKRMGRKPIGQTRQVPVYLP